ncbi:MinD/ParA family ATP-binding protein [Actinocatenispora rupis]|uniref:MinD/ParA family ATP-binding protein n=1 Tax=Actinocatenispora rupis TaxID=519421 RepID=UPI001EF1A985|nr:AAA family ATPase [Actinocatenispora rupis]
MEDSRTNPQPTEPSGEDGAAARQDAPGAWPPLPDAAGDGPSAPWPPREDVDDAPPAGAWPPPQTPPEQPPGQPVSGQPAQEPNPWSPFASGGPTDAPPTDWPAFAAGQPNGQPNGNGHTGAGNGHAGNGHITNAAWQSAPPPAAEPPAGGAEAGWPQIPEPPEIDPFGPATPAGQQAAAWPQFAPDTHHPDEPYDFRADAGAQPTEFQQPTGEHPTVQPPVQQPTAGYPTAQPPQPEPYPQPPQPEPYPQPPQAEPYLPQEPYPPQAAPQGGPYPQQQAPQPQQYPQQGQFQAPPEQPYRGQQQAHDPLPGGDHAPTADDFAQRRAARPADPIANQGVRRAMRIGTFGLVKLGPGRKEQDARHAVEMVRRNFGGLRQITVINPKGGAGKTVAVLMLAMTFGQKRGGYVLAWDNNETQGTLGMRAAQDFHNRTVRDLLRDLAHFRGPTGRVGDLSQYVRAQGEAMFDVLASDESATAGEMLTSQAFREIRDVVSRFYKLIVVDTGNNVRAANWQSAIDATDQLVVCMSARNDSAETAARALDHLEQTGRHDLVRRAVTVVSMPAHRKDLDLPAVQRHFSARTRAVLLAPYEKLLDSGEPIRYAGLTQSSRDAWLKIAAAVAEGL